MPTDGWEGKLEGSGASRRWRRMERVTWYRGVVVRGRAGSG